LVLLPLAYLWFRLVNNLRFEWSTNPQYSYGWLVPILIISLIVRQWEERRTTGPEAGGQRPVVRCPWSGVLTLLLLAFLYLPTRLVEEATPEWRPIQWALGIVTIGLTLGAVYLGNGGAGLRRLAFPVCFFFLAVPWPTVIESPVIQGLTRINSAVVVEVIDNLGVPAMQHGNVIEVGTGVVGIDDACSGIRSLQSSIMISLFLGAWYSLTLRRRLLLVPIGFVMAMGFNVCRTSLLTYIAAKKGVEAISQYHDPAGISITIACTAGMWVTALLLSRKRGGRKSEVGGRQSEVSSASSIVVPQWSSLSLFSLALLLWLATVEIGVQAWYRSREARLVAGPEWSLELPTHNPTFKAIAVPETTKSLLRYDEGRQGEWQEADGTQWQGFYFSWSPGRVAGYLAKRHTPEICMPAAGQKLLSGPEFAVVRVKGIDLPVRRYVFGTAAAPLHVFHCRWEGGATRDTYVAHESARFNLVRAIWAGRGNQGQKVLEFIASGCPDADQAERALVQQLEKLIRVEFRVSHGPL
jgi:exosortase